MADAFIRAVARMAVAQICEDSKFQAAQRPALDALADLLLRFLREAGKAAQGYAEHAGRAQANLADALLALGDLSVALPDVILYAEAVDEAPFVRPVPRFPVRKKPRLRTPSFLQKGEVPPNEAIPPWLPALPDKHTYMATPVWPEKRRELKAEQLEQGRERRRAEKSLVALHERVGALPRVVSERPVGATQVLWGRVTDVAAPGIQSGSLLAGLISGEAVRKSSNDAYLPPLLPEVAVQVNPVPDFGYSAEDVAITDEGKRVEEGSMPVKTVLDVFPELVAAGKRMKESQDDEDMEDRMDKGVGEGSSAALWSGWSVPETKVVARAGALSFDWSSKMKRRALEIRQLYESESRTEQRKEEKKETGKEEDEKLKRAEQIFDQADKLEEEEERGSGMERHITD